VTPLSVRTCLDDRPLTSRGVAGRPATWCRVRVRVFDGELLTANHLTVIEETITALSALMAWPGFESTMWPRIHAVPEGQRSRMPGVPGERVHREAGFICLVENLPKQSSTLTAAAAVQVLDDRQLRLHGIIQICRRRVKPDRYSAVQI
jgi:hypothetical protein